MTDVIRWSDTVIRLAGGDPGKGGLILGSPLAVAFPSVASRKPRSASRGGGTT